MHSEHVFIDWYGILEAGMAWDVGDLNGLSREEWAYILSSFWFIFTISLDFQPNTAVYYRSTIVSDIPQYKKDFYELEQDPDNIAYLVKQVHNFVLCCIYTETDAYIQYLAQQHCYGCV